MYPPVFIPPCDCPYPQNRERMRSFLRGNLFLSICIVFSLFSLFEFINYVPFFLKSGLTAQDMLHLILCHPIFIGLTTAGFWSTFAAVRNPSKVFFYPKAGFALFNSAFIFALIYLPIMLLSALSGISTMIDYIPAYSLSFLEIWTALLSFLCYFSFFIGLMVFISALRRCGREKYLSSGGSVFLGIFSIASAALVIVGLFFAAHSVWFWISQLLGAASFALTGVLAFQWHFYVQEQNEAPPAELLFPPPIWAGGYPPPFYPPVYPAPPAAPPYGASPFYPPPAQGAPACGGQPQAAVFCPLCGAPNPSQSQTCRSCGTPLLQPPSSPQGQ